MGLFPPRTFHFSESFRQHASTLSEDEQNSLQVLLDDLRPEFAHHIDFFLLFCRWAAVAIVTAVIMSELKDHTGKSQK